MNVKVKIAGEYLQNVSHCVKIVYILYYLYCECTCVRDCARLERKYKWFINQFLKQLAIRL